MSRGFTLIQISILLTIASLLFVATLPSTRSAVTGGGVTANRMNTVLSAMRQFQAANAYLPCPSDASLATGSTNYGVTAANRGTSNNCSGGTPAANYTDTANKIAIGGVPVRTLGLPSDYAVDAYGRAITYAVDTNATVCYQGSLTGQIVVTDNGTLNTSIAALISHGPDGHGAWIPLTGTSGTGSRLNASSTDTDEHLVNAHGLAGGGFPANYSAINSTVTSAESTSTTFVRKAPTTAFDDIVVYKSPLWTLNTTPSAYPFVIPAVTTTASHNSILNQIITITATYTTTVTFTGGPPTISLIIGSNTRTATYASGNGTTTLTFTYTVLPGDFTINGSGITIVSPMNTNGATFTSGTGYCVTPNFTSPSTSGVYVGAPSGVATDTSGKCTSGTANCIYVMDTNNDRMVKWGDTSTPAYSYQTGSYGTSGNNVFNNPGLVSVGPSTNYYSYTADAGNNRIVRWKNPNLSPGGSTSFGTSGSGTAGKFSSPMGIAADNTTNCAGTNPCLWITDTGNNQVQRCSGNMSGGTSNCSIVISGTVNGRALSTPTGITLDSTSSGCTTSPCLFIVDSGNNRILEFTTTAAGVTTYANSFGIAGSAGIGGTFNNPTGITLDGSGSCSGSTSNNCLWIADSSNNQVQRCSESMSGSTTCSIISSLSGASPSTFSTPTGVGIDASNNIFIVDDNNSRVVILTSAGAYSTSFGSGPNSGNSNFNF